MISCRGIGRKRLSNNKHVQRCNAYANRPIGQSGNQDPGAPGSDRRVFCVSGFRSGAPHILAERYCAARPSIWCWRDHSAGKSARRATPIPCGSRPSMAALTRSGARKASEIVIFTLRTLHRSRLAMLSVVTVCSAISSSSQRRPRAIDATKVARFSERSGRACCGNIPSGTRIARRRLDIVFCQAT